MRKTCVFKLSNLKDGEKQTFSSSEFQIPNNWSLVLKGEK